MNRRYKSSQSHSLFAQRIGLLISLLIPVAQLHGQLPAADAKTDFSPFWSKFKSAVIAGEKTTVAKMTKFPLSMYQENINDRSEFLRRYNEIFNGEANAAQCFASAEPQKESRRRYVLYCPFKETPNDRENAPIRFVFELTKSGWKFTGLDNINE